MKSRIFVILALTIACLTACDFKKDSSDAVNTMSSVKEDSLQQVIDQLRNNSDDMSMMKLKVLNILRQINEAEGRITTIAPENPDSEEIHENLVFIEQKMNEYKKALEDMQQLLRNTKTKSAEEREAMKEEIELLEEQLNAKDMEIATLRKQIEEKDSLLFGQSETIRKQKEAIDGLNQENAEKEKALIKQEDELNTAWYVFGTKKELQEQNILKKGKVLHSDELNKEYFTSIDIRVKKHFPLHTKKAKLLTPHPTDSYSLTKDNKGEYTLEISDVKAFWSLSKYLVISVK